MFNKAQKREIQLFSPNFEKKFVKVRLFLGL